MIKYFCGNRENSRDVSYDLHVSEIHLGEKIQFCMGKRYYNLRDHLQTECNSSDCIYLVMAALLPCLFLLHCISARYMVYLWHHALCTYQRYRELGCMWPIIYELRLWDCSSNLLSFMDLLVCESELDISSIFFYYMSFFYFMFDDLREDNPLIFAYELWKSGNTCKYSNWFKRNVEKVKVFIKFVKVQNNNI